MDYEIAKQAIDCLQKYQQQGQISLSVITKMELIVGCRDKRELNL